MSNADSAICLISDYDDQSHTLIGKLEEGRRIMSAAERDPQ